MEVEKGILKVTGKPHLGSIDQLKKLYGEFEDEYQFERQFNIGSEVDTDKIEASIDNGVLELVLPKNEEMKPRKIQVK